MSVFSFNEPTLIKKQNKMQVQEITIIFSLHLKFEFQEDTTYLMIFFPLDERVQNLYLGKKI